MAAAGYSAPPVADVDADTDAARHATYLWHRLIVALVFFVPLTDLSLTLSLIPSVRFPGWQYVLIACAAPVALWSAWPFHRAALRQPPARHADHGHPGVAGRRRGLRLVGVGHVRARPADRRPERAAPADPRGPAAASTWKWRPPSRRSCWLDGCMRRGPGAARARPCASWPPPGPGTSACSTPMERSARSGGLSCGPGTGAGAVAGGDHRRRRRGPVRGRPRWTAAR